MVTLCSLLADSVMPQSKFITSADRVFATAGTLVSPVRVLPTRCAPRQLMGGCAGPYLVDARPVLLGHAALGRVRAVRRAQLARVVTSFA